MEIDPSSKASFSDYSNEEALFMLNNPDKLPVFTDGAQAFSAAKAIVLRVDSPAQPDQRRSPERWVSGFRALEQIAKQGYFYSVVSSMEKMHAIITVEDITSAPFKELINNSSLVKKMSVLKEEVSHDKSKYRAFEKKVEPYQFSMSEYSRLIQQLDKPEKELAPEETVGLQV